MYQYRPQITATLEPAPAIVTDYLGGFQYVDEGLQFFPTAEGYVKYTESATNPFDYVFNYTDHLGNIRLSYAVNPATGLLKKMGENNYYPFGLKHGSYNTEEIIIAPRPVGGPDTGKFMKQKGEPLAKLLELPTENPTLIPDFYSGYNFKYQGQERQDELGLNWDSFKWRNYDYAIGRFMSIDPLSEKYAYNSPYAIQENKMGMGRELEGLELVLTHGTWAARGDKKLYSMDVADYKGGSTWQKEFSQKIAQSTGWESKSTFEFTWTGNNNNIDRMTAGHKLAADLMSEKNPFRDEKHATLAGHSHGGNVNKVAMNILEEAGWTVDVINMATPQRSDTQTNYNGNGKYMNFYNNSDIVQFLGAKPVTAINGARIDPNATINQEVKSSNNWFSNSGGHSFHQDLEAQKQIINAIKNFF